MRKNFVKIVFVSLMTGLLFSVLSCSQETQDLLSGKVAGVQIVNAGRSDITSWGVYVYDFDENGNIDSDQYEPFASPYSVKSGATSPILVLPEWCDGRECQVLYLPSGSEYLISAPRFTAKNGSVMKFTVNQLN